MIEAKKYLPTQGLNECIKTHSPRHLSAPERRWKVNDTGSKSNTHLPSKNVQVLKDPDNKPTSQRNSKEVLLLKARAHTQALTIKHKDDGWSTAQSFHEQNFQKVKRWTHLTLVSHIKLMCGAGCFFGLNSLVQKKRKRFMRPSPTLDPLPWLLFSNQVSWISRKTCGE